MMECGHLNNNLPLLLPLSCQKTSNAHDHQDRTNESCRMYADALVELCHQLNIKVINLWTAIQQREDWATSCLT